MSETAAQSCGPAGEGASLAAATRRRARRGLPAVAAMVALAGCGAVGAQLHGSAARAGRRGTAVRTRDARLTPTAHRRPASPRPLRGKTVAIDPGHDGGNFAHPEEIDRLVPAGGFMKACDTTGTETEGGYTEARFNLDVSLRLAHILRREGARVVLTRTTNTGVGPCINERAAIGNRAHANAAISIHADGFEAWGHGFQVLEPALVPGYTNRIVAPSARLGRVLATQMARYSGLTPSDYAGRNGIVVRSDLGGLNLSKVPKVFLECGNMKNPHDSALQRSWRWREHLAHVIARALTIYLRGRR